MVGGPRAPATEAYADCKASMRPGKKKDQVAHPLLCMDRARQCVGQGGAMYSQ